MNWIKENTIEFVILIAVMMLVVFITFIMFNITNNENETCIIYDEKVVCGQEIVVK